MLIFNTLKNLHFAIFASYQQVIPFFEKFLIFGRCCTANNQEFNLLHLEDGEAGEIGENGVDWVAWVAWVA